MSIAGEKKHLNPETNVFQHQSSACLELAYLADSFNDHIHTLHRHKHTQTVQHTPQQVHAHILLKAFSCSTLGT